jgi:hypothetical protein
MIVSLLVRLMGSMGEVWLENMDYKGLFTGRFEPFDNKHRENRIVLLA